MNPFTIYTNAATPVELRAPVGGRDYFRLENLSGQLVYWCEDSFSSIENCFPLSNDETIHFSRAIGDAVPQGTVWIIGSQAAPTQQRIIVKEQHIRQ